MRRSPRSIFQFLFFLSLLVVMVGGLVWANLNLVRRVPGGEEFIMLWKGARNFMIQGVTPYGTLTTLNIQTLVYGRAALDSENPLRVNVAFYNVLFFMPFGAISDPILARALWMTLLELALTALIWLALHLSRWKAAILYLVLVLLFGVFWSPSVSALFVGSSIILQTLCALAAFRALELDADELAGALLFFALVNVEATGAAILLILVWAASSERWRVVGGFSMTGIVLFVLGLLFLSNWPLEFIRVTLANWRMDLLPGTYPLFESWFPGVGTRLARGLGIAALVILVFEWRAAFGKDLRWLYWTACLTAALTPLLGMSFSLSMLVFSFPAFILVLSVMEQRWGLLGRLGAIFTLLLTFSGLWAAARANLTAGYLLAFPILLAILLYWIRWWAIRPPRLWADAVSGRY